MTVILLADGFEEIEALTPLDMLRRADLPVITVSVTREKAVTGAHGITVFADRTAEENDPATADHLILPGGMPGTLHLDASPVTDAYLQAVMQKGGRIAAICAAPLILGRRGLLQGKQAVCFPGFESELVGAQVLDRSRAFVTDGNITTAWGMEVALPFAKELVRLLSPKPTNGENIPKEYYHDKKFLEAVDVVIQTGKASTSFIQRRISVGYGKAAKYIDIMEGLGVIGEPNGQKPREILITMDEWKERLAQYDAD